MINKSLFVAIVAISSAYGCSDEAMDSRSVNSVTAEIPAASSEWDEFDEGAFLFKAPSTFVDREPQGIDSQVGEFASEFCVLSYDYGGYTGGFDNYSSEPSYVEETVDVDGEIATFVTLDIPYGDDELNFLASVHFRDLGVSESPSGVLGLTMILRCDTDANRQTFVPILGSVDFGG